MKEFHFNYLLHIVDEFQLFLKANPRTNWFVSFFFFAFFIINTMFHPFIEEVASPNGANIISIILSFSTNKPLRTSETTIPSRICVITHILFFIVTITALFFPLTFSFANEVYYKTFYWLFPLVQVIMINIFIKVFVYGKTQNIFLVCIFHLISLIQYGFNAIFSSSGPLVSTHIYVGRNQISTLFIYFYFLGIIYFSTSFIKDYQLIICFAVSVIGAIKSLFRPFYYHPILNSLIMTSFLLNIFKSIFIWSNYKHYNIILFAAVGIFGISFGFFYIVQPLLFLKFSRINSVNRAYYYCFGILKNKERASNILKNYNCYSSDPKIAIVLTIYLKLKPEILKRYIDIMKAEKNISSFDLFFLYESVDILSSLMKVIPEKSKYMIESSKSEYYKLESEFWRAVWLSQESLISYYACLLGERRIRIQSYLNFYSTHFPELNYDEFALETKNISETKKTNPLDNIFIVSLILFGIISIVLFIMNLTQNSELKSFSILSDFVTSVENTTINIALNESFEEEFKNLKNNIDTLEKSKLPVVKNFLNYSYNSLRLVDYLDNFSECISSYHDSRTCNYTFLDLISILRENRTLYYSKKYSIHNVYYVITLIFLIVIILIISITYSIIIINKYRIQTKSLYKEFRTIPKENILRINKFQPIINKKKTLQVSVKHSYSFFNILPNTTRFCIGTILGIFIGFLITLWHFFDVSIDMKRIIRMIELIEQVQNIQVMFNRIYIRKFLGENFTQIFPIIKDMNKIIQKLSISEFDYFDTITNSLYQFIADVTVYESFDIGKDRIKMILYDLINSLSGEIDSVGAYIRFITIRFSMFLIFTVTTFFVFRFILAYLKIIMISETNEGQFLLSKVSKTKSSELASIELSNVQPIYSFFEYLPISLCVLNNKEQVMFITNEAKKTTGLNVSDKFNSSTLSEVIKSEVDNIFNSYYENTSQEFRYIYLDKTNQNLIVYPYYIFDHHKQCLSRVTLLFLNNKNKSHILKKKINHLFYRMYPSNIKIRQIKEFPLLLKQEPSIKYYFGLIKLHGFHEWSLETDVAVLTSFRRDFSTLVSNRCNDSEFISIVNELSNSILFCAYSDSNNVWTILPEILLPFSMNIVNDFNLLAKQYNSPVTIRIILERCKGQISFYSSNSYMSVYDTLSNVSFELETHEKFASNEGVNFISQFNENNFKFFTFYKKCYLQNQKVPSNIYILV